MRPAVRGREGSGDRRGGGADSHEQVFLEPPLHGNCALLLPSEDDSSGPPNSLPWAGLKLYMGLDLLATDGPRVALSGADSTRICIYEVKDCVGKLTTDENTHG